MKCINMARTSFALSIIVKLIICDTRNEIGVVRASGNIAHSLLELLAGGRIDVDENQSHLTALRARLQSRPQLPSRHNGKRGRRFNPIQVLGNILTRIASSVDDIFQINTDQTERRPGSSNEIHFIEDTDERNFVTEPYPTRSTRSRQWVISRVSPYVGRFAEERLVDRLQTTTTVSPPPPTTTQFTLFPTFPTLFPPLFGAFTPFQFPQFTTPAAPVRSIFDFPTTTTQSTAITTTQSTTTKTMTTEIRSAKTILTEGPKQDSDLLKPYISTTKIPHRSKIVGSRLEFKLGGEKTKKQQGDDDDEPDNIETTEGPDEETSSFPNNPSSTDDDDDLVSTNNPLDNGNGDDSGGENKPSSGGSGLSTRNPGHLPEDGGSSSYPKTDDDDSNSSGASKCTDGKWSEWKEKIPCSGKLS